MYHYKNVFPFINPFHSHLRRGMDDAAKDRFCDSRHSLTSFAKGTVFVFDKYKLTDTQQGKAVVVTFDTEVDGKPCHGEMLLAQRFINDCERNIPCVCLYNGLSLARSGNRYHALEFVSSKKAPKAKKRKITGLHKCTLLECDRDCCRGFCFCCGQHVPAEAQCNCFSSECICGMGTACIGHCTYCGSHRCDCDCGLVDEDYGNSLTSAE